MVGINLDVIFEEHMGRVCMSDYDIFELFWDETRATDGGRMEHYKVNVLWLSLILKISAVKFTDLANLPKIYLNLFSIVKKKTDSFIKLKTEGSITETQRPSVINGVSCAH